MLGESYRGRVDALLDGAGTGLGKPVLHSCSSRDTIVRDGGTLQFYTLMIDMPWRPVSTTIQAQDDRQAAAKAGEMVSSTCTQIDSLGDYRARLTRADGSDVFEPVSVAALIART